jgi:hypothetical protein
MLQEIMGTAELRKEAHRFINRANDRVLKKVLALDTENEKIVIVGYEPDGTPITQEELIREAKEASARVKAGEYITQEDMEKEVENW